MLAQASMFIVLRQEPLHWAVLLASASDGFNLSAGSLAYVLGFVASRFGEVHFADKGLQYEIQFT